MKIWTSMEQRWDQMGLDDTNSTEVPGGMIDKKGIFRYVRYTGDTAPTQDMLNAHLFPAPTVITRVQFWQQAVSAGLCSQQEAIAAFNGIIPATLQAAINTLPSEQQFAAMAALQNTVFDQSNPITIALAQAFWPPPADALTELTIFWAAASLL